MWSLAYAYAAAGHREEALKAVSEFQRTEREGWELALIYRVLGATEEAIRSPLKAFDAGNISANVRNVPALAFLHDDLRFQDLMHRMKVPYAEYSRLIIWVAQWPQFAMIKMWSGGLNQSPGRPICFRSCENNQTPHALASSEVHLLHYSARRQKTPDTTGFSVMEIQLLHYTAACKNSSAHHRLKETV